MVYGGVTAIRDMADDLRQVGDLARACLVGEIPGPDIHYAALMAGPGFFDDPRTWQVSQGETPGCPGCRRSPPTDLVIATALARGTHASAITTPGRAPSRYHRPAHRQQVRAGRRDGCSWRQVWKVLNAVPTSYSDMLLSRSTSR